MIFDKLAFVALALASSIAAAPTDTAVRPAVQPGGDIPSTFRPVAPIPKGGDIPAQFNAPRAEFEYVRRQVRIPMRDGAKLYAMLISPRTMGKFPIMLDRSPYSSDKST